MRISDWSSDVCSSDLATPFPITLTQLTVLTRRSASSADTSPLRYSTVDVVGIRPSANPRGTIEDRFRLACRSNGISFPPQSRYRGLDPSLFLELLTCGRERLHIADQNRGTK